MRQSLEEIGLTILVLKVVSMFPGIEDHERDPRLRQIGLVVVDLSGQETAAHRFPYESGPPRSHDRRGSLSHLPLEGVEVAEVPVDRLRERSVGLLLPMRSEVLPEERVEDMAGQVEGQGPFQRREAREVPLDTGLMQLLERIIGAFDIPGVVLVVVELHDAP